MSEMLTGTIASLKIARSTDKWDTYDIAFPDGSVEKVAHARDQEPLKVGDVIECSKGQWNWLTKSVSSNGGGKHSTTASNGERVERPHREEQSSEKKTYNPPVKTTTGQKDDYFKEKFQYEVTEMYPKIEFQAFATMAVNIYAAGLPFLAEKPSTPEELDAYLQMALDKARAVFEVINKK